jgi:nitric oxide dioxygenase
MMAMLSHLSALDMPAPVHFLHACRNSEVHAMKQQLDELKTKHANLRTYISYEQVQPFEQQDSDYQQQGYLDLTKLTADWLPTDADYYLCGPKPFMQVQYQNLRQHGIASERIHYEAFGTGGLALSS